MNYAEFAEAIMKLIQGEDKLFPLTDTELAKTLHCSDSQIYEVRRYAEIPNSSARQFAGRINAITELIRNEDKKRPLTDENIAKIFGIHASKVWKLRTARRIPNSQKRKRNANQQNEND